MKLTAFFIGLIGVVAGYFGYQYSNDTLSVGAPFSQFISTQLAGSPVNGYVLSTDGSVNSWVPAAAGGSSKWTDGGSFIFPSTGEYVSATYFTGTSTTATSTFNNIGLSNISALTSAGLLVYSNNHTQIADFGAGSSANSIFFGGVNINGATRLATSLNGVLQAQAGAVTATSTGNLTETVTGLQFDNTRALIGGSAILSLTSGYEIPLTASTTEWATAYASTTALTPSYIRGLFSNTATGLTYTAGTGATSLTSGYGIPLTASTTEWTNFYNTPSTRITAGTGIDWSGNTLNGVYTAGDALTLTGEDFDFDGGASPQGELGGTWASPTIDDSLAVTGWNLTTPTLTSFFGTPCTGNEFLQDIGDTGTFTCVAASTGSSNWTLMSGGLRTSTSTDFARAAYFVATSTTATSTYPILSVSTVFSLFGNIYSTLAAFGTSVVQAITSVAPTGIWDFGGATSIEVVNGTNPTVDTTGEIALDTTGDQLLVADSGGTARVVQIEDVKIWSVTVASTSDAFISSGLIPVPTQLDGYTITRIQCHVTGGTSKVVAVEDASANSSEDVTCATTNTTDDGSITNATYTANELAYIDFGATSGTVNYVTISVFGNWDRE